MQTSPQQTTLDSAINKSATLSIVLPIVGALCITLASQIRIELGFTPVPITGQTFAVIIWGIVFGRKQRALAAASYLLAGIAGLPVFTGFTALSAMWGPTSGYLIGFIPGSWLAGWLQERTRSKSVSGLFGISLAAHIPILAVGASVMAAFFGVEQLWLLAIAPFLLGDVVKSASVALVCAAIGRKQRGA